MRRRDHVDRDQHVILRFPEPQGRIAAARVRAAHPFKTPVLPEQVLRRLDIGLSVFFIKQQSHQRKLRKGAGDHAVLKGMLTLRTDVVQIAQQLVNGCLGAGKVLICARCPRIPALLFFCQIELKNALGDVDDAGVVAAFADKRALLILTKVNQVIGKPRAGFKPFDISCRTPCILAQADGNGRILNSLCQKRWNALLGIKGQWQKLRKLFKQLCIQLRLRKIPRSKERRKEPVPSFAMRTRLLGLLPSFPAGSFQIE